jgi:hypothetical protein
LLNKAFGEWPGRHLDFRQVWNHSAAQPVVPSLTPFFTFVEEPMSYVKWIAAAVVLAASVAAVGCQQQAANGDAKKCTPCANATSAVYDVTIDGMS